jgi:hypothetical protein
MKGASEILIQKCDKIMNARGEVEPLDARAKEIFDVTDLPLSKIKHFIEILRKIW